MRRANRRFRARVALGLVAVFAGCDVYDQALIGTAFGPGGSGSGASAGTFPGAGRGGSAGTAGAVANVGGNAGVGGGTGGASGSGATGNGGSVSSGGTSGTEGGSDGGGGEDPGVGGSAGSSGSGGAGGSAGAGAGGKGGGGSGGAATGGAGTGGMTGGAGSGGAGSGAGGAGAGGTAGTGGAAGTGGMAETCSGCARLSVPLAATADKAHFTLLLPGTTDLSAATITFRVAVLSGTGGSFKGYIQQGSPDYQLQDGTATTLASIGGTLKDIAWSIAGAGTAADKTAIQRVGIEINGASGAAWANPTVLYVDSITIAGANPAVTAYTFDTTTTVHTTPTGQGPTGRLYLNNYSEDTTVTGAAISWLGP